jgi:hypothetical protein
MLFRMPPNQNDYVFSSDKGKTPLTKGAITKAMRKIRQKFNERMGIPDKEAVQNLTSHSERVSLCYWMDRVMKMEEAEAMEWVAYLASDKDKKPRVYTTTVAFIAFLNATCRGDCAVFAAPLRSTIRQCLQVCDVRSLR